MNPFPGWHPMIVHFPVALTLTAALLLLAARLTNRPGHAAALASVGTWNLCLAALGALFALATGLAAVVNLQVGPAARQSVSLHMKWAVGTTLALLLLSVWRAAGAAPAARPQRLFLLVLMFTTAGMLGTAYRGGVNVYGYAIGVTQLPAGRP